MLLIQRQRTTQPRLVTGVNWGNPLSRGLVSLVLPTSSGLVDVVRMAPLANVFGSANTSSSQVGVGANINGANKAFERVADDVQLTQGSVYALTTVLGSATVDGGIFVLSSSNNSGTPPYVALSIKANFNGTAPLFGHSIGGGSNSITGFSVLSSVFGNVECFIGRASSGLQTLLYCVNGVDLSNTSGTVTGSLSYSSGKRIIVGEDYRLATRNSNRLVHLGAVWNRFLSDAEVVVLRSNPWQLFAPVRIMVPASIASAGATYTLTQATYVPGSLTSSSVTPRIVRTKA